MIRPVLNSYVKGSYTCSNKNIISFGANYKQALSCIVKSEKLSEKLTFSKFFAKAKENAFEKLSKYLSKSNKGNKAEKLPLAKKPLTAEMALEDKDQFLKKLGEETVRNRQYGSGLSPYGDTLDTLNGLPPQINIPNKPWDPPMTDSGHLTNTAKDTIIKNIENSNLSSYDKEKYIQQIKRSYFEETGHNDVVSFGDHISEKDMTDIQNFGGLTDAVDSHGMNVSDFDISDTLQDHIDTGVDILEHTENIIEHGLDTLLDTLGHITDNIL